MSPAWIRVRANGDGSKSFMVVYRRRPLGVSTWTVPIESAGSFRGWPGGKTKQGKPAAPVKAAEREARDRRDLVAGWLARGLDPKAELAALIGVERHIARTRDQWRDQWLNSRHDIAAKSDHAYRAGVNAVFERLPGHDLERTTVQDCLDAVGKLAGDYAPSTVNNYWTAFAMLLEYVGLDPNPARDRKVKMPKVRRVPPNVPTHTHVEAMLDRLATRYLLPFALLEQTAARVETIDGATWGVVDAAGLRLRVQEKGRKYRWVPVPAWLMAALEASCPVEDRVTDRRLFPNVTSGQLRGAMAAACKTARIPHYTPHDLRHRRASLWHLQAIPDAVLAERLGHERASFSKDVYVHVMPDAEVPQATWETILAVTLG